MTIQEKQKALALYRLAQAEEFGRIGLADSERTPALRRVVNEA